MAFWSFGFHPTSAIDALLAKDDINLEDLLSEKDLLQECKAQHTKLFDYFRKQAVIIQMLDYITSDTMDEEKQQKFAFIVSEVIASEVWTIFESLMEHPQILVDFWRYLDRPAPLNPLQASYFSKVTVVILQKKTKEMLQFIREQPDSVRKIMNHMDTSAIMDLLLKLIAMEEMIDGQGVVDWLASEKLMSTLVSKLDPTLEADWHGIAAQVLLDIIAISQSSSPDQPSIGTNALIRELKTEETLTRIVDYMLDPSAPNSTSSLINGVTIFIELIRRNYCDYDPQSIPALPTPPVDLSDLLLVLGDRVEDFQRLLVKPKSITRPLETTLGNAVPLGFERLKICELFAELLHCSNMGLLNMVDATARDASPSPEISASSAWNEESSATAAPDEKSDGEPISTEEEVDLDSNALSRSQTTGEATLALPNTSSNLATTTSTSSSATPAPSPIIATELNPSSSSSAPAASSSVPQSTAETTTAKTKPSSRKARVKNISVGEALKLNFVRARIIPTCVDLFFTFAWNNFLHTVVYDMLHQILNGRAEQGSANRELIFSIFKDAKLTKKITKSQRLCDYEVEQPKGLRTGYMGHVTFIAEEVVNCFERYPTVAESVEEYTKAEDWQEYVQRILKETIERDRQPLGGVRPTTRVADGGAGGNAQNGGSGAGGGGSAGFDYDEDDGIEPVADGDMANDQFARYLCQQITSDLPDKFGSSDDEDEEDDDEVAWIGEFDCGSGFDMRAAFGSNHSTDAFNAHRAGMDDSFDDSDDDDETPSPRWTGTDAPPTMAQFAAEAPNEKLTVADWNADFERSFDLDHHFPLDGDGDADGSSSTATIVTEGVPPRSGVTSPPPPFAKTSDGAAADQGWANFGTAFSHLRMGPTHADTSGVIVAAPSSSSGEEDEDEDEDEGRSNGDNPTRHRPISPIVVDASIPFSTSSSSSSPSTSPSSPSDDHNTSSEEDPLRFTLLDATPRDAPATATSTSTLATPTNANTNPATAAATPATTEGDSASVPTATPSSTTTETKTESDEK